MTTFPTVTKPVSEIKDTCRTCKQRFLARAIKLIWGQIMCELWFTCLAFETAVQILHLLMTGLRLQCLVQSGIKGELLWWSAAREVNYLSKMIESSACSNATALITDTVDQCDQPIKLNPVSCCTGYDST